jgi:hypothetical protein
VSEWALGLAWVLELVRVLESAWAWAWASELEWASALVLELELVWASESVLE